MIRFLKFPAVVLGFAVLTGCANDYYFVTLSPGYDPASSLTHALPAIELSPGETRKAFVASRWGGRRSETRVVSEDPQVVRVWAPAHADDVVRIQAVGVGATLVHGGRFPFQPWDPAQSLVERTRWRWSLRPYLPRPVSEEEFRKIPDAELWQTAVRARSAGAMRVVVNRDPLQFFR